MTELHPELRENVRMLGELLGQSIRRYPGQECYELIEEIRAAAKSDRRQESGSGQRLVNLLRKLSDDELLPVTRAFNQFLNLANLAEQYHGIRRKRGHQSDLMVESLGEVFERLKQGDVTPEELHQRVADLRIEFVLTAHPTEVARRTLIMKYDEMSDCLARLDHDDLMPAEREEIVNRLSQLVTEAWHTDEIRQERPTAVDEAKWGFAVIENSLWQALPQFLRSLDTSLEDATGKGLPLQASPIRIASWMGGDRDGNPNVTHKVTRRVFLLGRWMAADLYLRDIQALRAELSMWQASDELKAEIGSAMHALTEGEARVLKPGSVAEATRPQTESVYPEQERGKRNSFYGLGWVVRRTGVYGHGGSEGTYAFVDPRHELVVLVFTQSPGGTNPRDAFFDAVVAAVIDE